MLNVLIATFSRKVKFQSPHVHIVVKALVANTHRLWDKPSHVCVFHSIPLHAEAVGDFSDAE
jgi:hypothetical protein